MANSYVKFYRGSLNNYKAAINAGTVNDDTLYFITEAGQSKGALYLGTTLISKDISKFSELEDINLASELKDKDLLVYSSSDEKWINKSIIDAIGVFVGAKDGLQGANGLVPAPGENDENLFLRGDGTWAAPEAATTVTIDVDNKSISFLEDGETISLHNFGKKFYAYIEATETEPAHYEERIVDASNPWKEGLEPKVVLEDGVLVLGWYEPNPTTIEGVNSQVSSLQTTVEDIKSAIGSPAEEGKEATGLYAKADADTVYTKEETEELIAIEIAKYDHLSRKTFASIEAAEEFIATAENAEDYIYMISTGDTEYDKYDEYLYIDGSLEKVGAWEVDLTDYATKEEVAKKVDAVEGKSLVLDTEIAKLVTVKENAEPNYISSVNETELKVDNGLLSIVSVVPSKISGLEDLLNEKANKTELNAVKEDTNNALARLGVVESSVQDITAQLNSFVTLKTFNSELNEIKAAITWKSI